MAVHPRPKKNVVQAHTCSLFPAGVSECCKLQQQQELPRRTRETHTHTHTSCYGLFKRFLKRDATAVAADVHGWRQRQRRSPSSSLGPVITEFALRVSSSRRFVYSGALRGGRRIDSWRLGELAEPLPSPSLSLSFCVGGVTKRRESERILSVSPSLSLPWYTVSCSRARACGADVVATVRLQCAVTSAAVPTVVESDKPTTARENRCTVGDWFGVVGVGGASCSEIRKFEHYLFLTFFFEDWFLS